MLGPARSDSSETPPSVNDLYLHLHTVNHDRRHSSILDRSGSMLRSGRREATRATPEQSVDDEAVYLNVAGECSKGRVYGLGSVGRKKRRYGTPGASTSQSLRMWCRGRVRCRCGATTKGYELHASASWDGHGRNRPSSRTTTTTATTTATS
ncbi:hypothetical protein Sjap_019440 [Stephania japonica]|uniref:Uncharacterized protein n=1 Tax=Stephania japonica TaxID=461633 RepID=A0AAP0EYT8_9MAGN